MPRVTKHSLTHQSPISHSSTDQLAEKSAIGDDRRNEISASHHRRRKMPRVAIPLVLPSLESIARYRVSAVIRRVVKTR